MMDNLKKCLTEFEETISLENTRRQYEIIELLATEYGKHMQVDENNRDIVYRNNNLYDSIFDFLIKETEGLDSVETGAANPLIKYIQSRNRDELFNIGINDDNSINHHKLAALVTYFSLMRYYEGIIDNKHLVNTVNAIDRSDFDRIVEAIRRILQIDICHIVSVKDGDSIVLASSNERYYSYKEVANEKKLLAFSQLVTSGIAPIPCDNRNKSLRTINDVIHEEENNNSKWLIDKTIGCCSVQYDEEHELKVLIIRISPEKSINNVYLVALLDENEFNDIGNRKLLKKAVEIVFLKSKLCRLVDANYENLCSSRMRFDYIPRINGGDACVAYHISDLHIDSSHSLDKTMADIRYYVGQAERDAQKEKIFDTPDLLLITGDICNYAPTAYGLESNYDHAAQIIKHFVSCFWCVTEKNSKNEPLLYLRSDWKKRIVFCPGNHDYASMNELKANSSRRETTGGNPVEYSGGTIAKFTYYINALRKYFDVSDAHIDDKLNFVRYYTKIGAIIVSLNSCSEANSKLQNKAHIDFDQANIIERTVRFLIDSKRESTSTLPAVMVLSHHSYNYFPNYFKDRHPLGYQKVDTSVQDALEKIKIRNEFKRNIVVKLNKLATDFENKSKQNIHEAGNAYKALIAHILAILFALRFSDDSTKMKEFREKAFCLYAKAYGLIVDETNLIKNLYDEATTKNNLDGVIKEAESILNDYSSKQEFITLSELLNQMTKDRFYIEKGSIGMKANKEDSRILLRLNQVCSDIEESISDYEALQKVGQLFIKEDNTHWLCGHVHEDAKANVGLFKFNDIVGTYDEKNNFVKSGEKIGKYGKAHEAKNFSSDKWLNCYRLVHNFKNETVSYQSILIEMYLETNGIK